MFAASHYNLDETKAREESLMSYLSRRQCCARLATLLGALAVGSCATVSPQEERKLGGKGAEELERTVGLVREPQLVQYIEAIGTRLAQAAGHTDVAWQWSVADEADANAFALPGGWVYVTRGLLALTNSEDELAGVMAHEMAHVTERHAVKGVEAATPLAVLFGVPGSLLGMVSPSLGGIIGGAGRVISGLTLAPYSREQEREADRIGIATAARAGWDPSALAVFLNALARADAPAAEGTAKRSSFFATHPSTPDRVANIEAAARSLSRASATPIAGNRAALLGRLEGLIVGNNPANGVFAGPLFLHADLHFALEMPAGWKTGNSPEAAGAVAAGNVAVVVLQVVAKGDDPVAGARAEGLTEAQVPRLRRFQVAGLPAAELIASTRNGTRLALTWIAHGNRIFRVTGACEGAAWERYQKDFQHTAASFRPLRSEDRARITHSRLRIRSARAGERIAQVLARGGAAWTPAEAAAANGVATEQTLEPDWPVKVAVSERYRP